MFIKVAKSLGPVVQQLDNPIHWIAIYPVDSVIHSPNNRGQLSKKKVKKGELALAELSSAHHRSQAQTNIKPEHDVIYVDTFHLFYLRRIFLNPKCGLSGDFLANHVRLAGTKVCSSWQAFPLPSPSQREHHFKLNENMFPPSSPLQLPFGLSML